MQACTFRGVSSLTERYGGSDRPYPTGFPYRRGAHHAPWRPMMAGAWRLIIARGYRSKAILAFQTIEGRDVCFFSMCRDRAEIAPRSRRGIARDVRAAAHARPPFGAQVRSGVWFALPAAEHEQNVYLVSRLGAIRAHRAGGPTLGGNDGPSPDRGVRLNPSHLNRSRRVMMRACS